VQDVQITLPIGRIVQDRYIVEDLLGKGGFGAVYLVRDQQSNGDLFAMKELIDASKKERERFTFEGEVLKRLDHRSLPRVYRTFEDDKNYRAYILMDYIPGPNLETLRKEQPENRFSLSQTMQIMAPIVEAVGYLHKQQPPIVHRDIKPANIIVPRSGDGAVLVDFGIAKEYDMEGTTTAIRRCSPGYGAPEQYARGTGPRTDIYGLGATFYALLAGHVPTDALYRITQLGSKHVDPLEPVKQSVPEVPQHVSDAILRAMAINSNDRFATVEEFWQALNAQPVGEALPVAAALPDAPPAQSHRAPSMIPAAIAAPDVLHKPPRRVMANRSKRSWALVLLLSAIALLALLSGVLYGTGLWSRIAHTGRSTTAVTTQSSRSATATPQAKATQSGTTAGATSAAVPVVQPTATTTPQPRATATSGSGSYPQLRSLYTGTISDQATSPPTNASMQISQIHQNGTNVTGHLAVGAGLLTSDSFSGTVSTGNSIQFTVPSYAGLAPLLFQGQIHSDGSISGTYCSYRGANQCDKSAGGWGNWNVTPSSSESTPPPGETPTPSSPESSS